MRRIRTTIHALIGATVIAGGMAALTPAAQANDITVACGPNAENALVAAINLANSNNNGADTLKLASGCTYTLTSAHDGLANGLPVITTPIEMIGPATITRPNSAPPFRIAEVSSTGSLTLTTSVALANGRALLGDGGGILNHGAVTLTNSSLSGNTAVAGNGGGLANADTPSGTAPAATFTNSQVTGNASNALSASSRGGGIYNGTRGTLTSTGSLMRITGNAAVFGRGGGIAAVHSTATTLTDTTVTNNAALGNAGGVYRDGDTTMTTTNSPITANVFNNCLGSVPVVPNCIG